jgi:hypothetical protein
MKKKIQEKMSLLQALVVRRFGLSSASSGARSSFSLPSHRLVVILER